MNGPTPDVVPTTIKMPNISKTNTIGNIHQSLRRQRYDNSSPAMKNFPLSLLMTDIGSLGANAQCLASPQIITLYRLSTR